MTDSRGTSCPRRSTDVVVGLKRSRPVRQFKKTLVGRLVVGFAAAHRQNQAAARGSAASTTPAPAGRLRNRLVVSAAPRFRVEEYLAKCRTLPIEDNVVLYESFDGNGMLDNPLSIFCELLKDPDFAELKHVWVIADAKVYAESMAEYAGHPCVSFVTYKSKEYFDRLSTAKFLVNNTSFPREFAKRPGQVYVNTWHGIPLKRMGYDVPDGATGARNIVRNLVAADYLVSANAYMTDVMYKQAFKLDGIYRGTVIQAGYPRIDGQFLNEHGQARVREGTALQGCRGGRARDHPVCPDVERRFLPGPRLRPREPRATGRGRHAADRHQPTTGAGEGAPVRLPPCHFRLAAEGPAGPQRRTRQQPARCDRCAGH